MTAYMTFDNSHLDSMPIQRPISILTVLICRQKIHLRPQLPTLRFQLPHMDLRILAPSPWNISKSVHAPNTLIEVLESIAHHFDTHTPGPPRGAPAQRASAVVRHSRSAHARPADQGRYPPRRMLCVTGIRGGVPAKDYG
jgi:hypothetical protein